MKTLYNLSRGAKLVSDAKAMLGNEEASPIAKGAALATLATNSWKNGVELYGHLKTRLCYTVAISESEDPLFMLAYRWVSQNIPERRRRAVVAKSRDNSVALGYDGNREQFMTIEGHRIAVSVVSTGVAAASGDDEWDSLRRWKVPQRIIFTSLTAAGRDAVERLLAGLVEDFWESRVGLPDLFTWGDRSWCHGGDLLPRPLESVTLAPGQTERILGVLEAFELMEERYVSLGIPWHSGLLFHGPPGTGKSSIARAIASHLDRSLYYLSLSALTSDEALFRAVGTVPAHGILLLEDVDTMSAMVDRSTAKGVSMSAVLNVLDGVMTPHGLVKILSTNHLERLDPAVYRPGRVDLVEEIGFCTAEMVERIFTYAFPDEAISVPSVVPGISGSKVVGAMRPVLNDPAAARRAVLDVCSGHGEGVTEALHAVPPSLARRALRREAGTLADQLFAPPTDPGVHA